MTNAKANPAPVNQHLFRSLLDQLPPLNANQIEDLLSGTMDIRRARASLSGIEGQARKTARVHTAEAADGKNQGKPEPEFSASDAADV
ncbi:hypothetical protein [Phycobacter sp. K97]|uniref:hypothetical protein n=1 Tax=Phycobacter sedimenti TaxID=3133977 RepID=UPI00311E93EA